MDRCPHCGLTYDELRTGFTYSDVYMQLWVGDEDSSRWVNKRRHTVLGRWREIKQGLWAEHLEMCERAAEYAAQLETIESAESFADDAEGLDFGAFEAFMVPDDDGLPVPF